MNNTLTKKDNPRFELINKYNVAILSLKNQLKNAMGIDELTRIANKIVDLEQQILIEKTTGYKELEEEKKRISMKVDKLRRELSKTESALSQIENNIDIKLNSYRKALQNKIEMMTNEYNVLNEVNLDFEEDEN